MAKTRTQQKRPRPVVASHDKRSRGVEMAAEDLGLRVVGWKSCPHHKVLTVEAPDGRRMNMQLSNGSRHAEASVAGKRVMMRKFARGTVGGHG